MPPAKGPDYSALRRKLAAGLPLLEAAALAGMTEDAAKDYLAKRESEDDKSLRAFSDQALRVSLAALTRAVKEKNRKVSQHDQGDDGSFTMYKEAVIDVDAAKALLKAGMDARAMLRRAAGGTGGGEEAGERDLFDIKVTGWSFKKRE